ncbi:Deoxyribodipyrimidine photolyase, type II (EC [Olavius sp. associated proteobacterium Delta 1]|nr:Deoxyribodipyrimidine photolyase, type II (EC [Olavius sp. associated proteobacterium Delta 1]
MSNSGLQAAKDSFLEELIIRRELAINNKYFLDGRDPNSYTGVAWVYGVHDRAGFERPILGKVR